MCKVSALSKSSKTLFKWFSLSVSTGNGKSYSVVRIKWFEWGQMSRDRGSGHCDGPLRHHTSTCMGLGGPGWEQWAFSHRWVSRHRRSFLLGWLTCPDSIPTAHKGHRRDRRNAAVNTHQEARGTVPRRDAGRVTANWRPTFTYGNAQGRFTEIRVAERFGAQVGVPAPLPSPCCPLC